MWVAVALCIIVVLIALVLSVPVDLGLRVEVYGRPIAYFTFEWLFGRVTSSFRSCRTGEESAHATTGQDQASEEKAKKKNKKGRTPGRRQIRRIVSIIRIRGLCQSLVLLSMRLIRRVRVRSLFADFRVGLDDPCDTALVVGTLSAATMIVSKGRRVRLEPAFAGGLVFEGDAVVKVRLLPITLLPPLLVFFLSPSTWRVLVTLIRWKIANR